MIPIEIDEEVYAELGRRAVGFDVRPNDVLRSVLGLAQSPALVAAPAKDSAPTEVVSKQGLAGFLLSRPFQSMRIADDRYRALLGWLNSEHREEFERVALAFRRGRRRYFAQSQDEITENGRNVTAKTIPDSKLWVLTTLDNKTKREIIAALLDRLGYAKQESELAVRELPDSGIKRGGSLTEYQ